MTADENQQLFEFIGKKFDVLDQRLTRVEVLHEEHGHRFEIVEEGLTAFREQVDRRFEQVGAELRSIHSGVVTRARRMDEPDER